jgi:hypothetical protein
LADLSYRYTFDVLGELFFGKMFGYMKERTDIGNCMKAIDALLPAYTISGIVPSYLSKLCLSSTVLFSPSIRGAMGAVKLLDNASKTAVKRRNQEIEEKKDDRRDILRKLIEINADRGAHINFTERDIQRESYTAL